MQFWEGEKKHQILLQNYCNTPTNNNFASNKLYLVMCGLSKLFYFASKGTTDPAIPMSQIQTIEEFSCQDYPKI